MVRKEDVDFYCSFSRRELQSLCKKYNLPANRSSSDMAESLASYFEKNSLSSVAFGVGLGGIHGDSAAASLVATMQNGAPTSGTGDVKKDCYGNRLAAIREDYSQTRALRESGCALGDKMRYQELNGGLIGSPFTQFIRCLNDKGPTANSENDFDPRTGGQLENGSQAQIRQVNNGERPQETPSPGYSAISRSSSFEFYVSSEEGINLSVDLNFNPSEWIDNMRNEVSVCESMRHKKSRSSDQGIDYPTENKKQTSQSPWNGNVVRGKGGHAVKESPISPVTKDNSQTPSGYQCSGEGSLASSAAEPCSRIRDSSDNCKKDEGLNLSMPDSSAPGQIASCSESCSKSCCLVSLDLDCVNSPGKKSATDSVTGAAECLMNLDTLDHPAGDLPSEIMENPSPESPQKVGNSSTVTPICPGGGGSEISSSEAEPYLPKPPCSPCKTGRSWNSSDPKLIVDAESSGYSCLIKFQADEGKNGLPSNAEEQEKSEIISGQERSE